MQAQSSRIDAGKSAHDWASDHMPVFRLAENFVKSKIKIEGNPFEGLKLAACLHISKETSVLINSLHDFGFEILLVAANPLSSQDEIASFLMSKGIKVLGQKGEATETYSEHIRIASHSSPNFILDDGGELHVTYANGTHDSCAGGTDETTTGTVRLRALDAERKLRYPVIPVNEAATKHIFDNMFGTGQSALDGLIRATGLLVAGKTVLVVGYGWVGRGVALRLSGMGAKVIVTEIDPIKALEAHLNGFSVHRMVEAVQFADIVLTCSGQVNVVGGQHFGILKDGAILGNLGHFDREIDVKKLFALSRRSENVRENITKLELGPEQDPKEIYLLCEGRVVNLAAAEGHPPEVMQLSFANQLLSIHHLLTSERKPSDSESKFLPFPGEIDSLVADFALKGFGLSIDSLTEEQLQYSHSF
ncbi:MAG: adenosylhomocysteinase [Thaumarchaeota archaeon]|nr:adenosylhomocysteinase [Nitrososphaerota archaeon]